MTNKRTKIAVEKYGVEKCHRAYKMNKDGCGARNIGFELGLTTLQADAAINAGREIAEGGAA